jgi:hypothetical protein
MAGFQPPGDSHIRFCRNIGIKAKSGDRYKPRFVALKYGGMRANGVCGDSVSHMPEQQATG